MFPNDLARSYDGSQKFALFRSNIVLRSDFNFCLVHRLVGHYLQVAEVSSTNSFSDMGIIF